MDSTSIANYIATAIYAGGWLYLVIAFIRRQNPGKASIVAIGLCALVAHGIGVYGTVFTSQGFNFSVFKLPSLFFWVMVLLVLISGLQKPLYNLYIFLFPLTTIAVLSSQFSDSPELTTHTPYFHILLAVLASGILTIATLQALVLAYQNHQLKHKHMTGAVRLLPPLQTMENLMFELLWVGEILLTLLIISGLAMTKDILAQRQGHILVFSILAWAIYATLLWGRLQRGWRGNVAVRWTLGGFACLLLAYFGTQLVYQVILSGGQG